MEQLNPEEKLSFLTEVFVLTEDLRFEVVENLYESDKKVAEVEPQK